MEYKCDNCNKKFGTEESLKQHNSAVHSSKEAEEKKPIKIKKYVLIAIVVVALVLVIAGFYLKSQKPGLYDDFAKCLKEKNIIVYGNDFCQYTGKQLNMFGKSEKYLDYVKCANNKELCDSKGIKITPTWEINGKMYEQIQSFEKLAELSGCKLQ